MMGLPGLRWRRASAEEDLREAESELDLARGLEPAESEPRLRSRRTRGTPVIVFGSGEEARRTVALLRACGRFRVVGVVADDAGRWPFWVCGLRPRRLAALPRLCARRGVRIVVVANEVLEPSRRAALDEAARKAGAVLRALPSPVDLLPGAPRSGAGDGDDAALLERPPSDFRLDMAEQAVTGASVLVTGAGGSIGGALCRRLLSMRPRRLVLYEIGEYALYTVLGELEAMRRSNPALLHCEIMPVLGSVCDVSRLEQTLWRFRVVSVYHAAAFKHVPLVEQNILEGVRNNVVGTRRVVEAALQCGVESMVLVSTDKAVRPTSVMGATKRFSEIVVQDAQRRAGACRFSIVRFGNVLDSSGSVAPLFRAQISRGGPVTVTHPEMTRYFMTISEAAELVIQAGAMAEGGEVFLLDMGQPVRILDLARRMIEFSGRRPLMPGEAGPGIPIIFTGVRDGEKLYEELLIDDSAQPSSHPKIAQARERCPDAAAVSRLLNALEEAEAQADASAAVRIMRDADIGYTPSQRAEGAWAEPAEASARSA